MWIEAKTQIRYPMGLERRYAKELRSYVRQELKFWRDEIPYLAAETLRNAIRKDAEESEEDDDWISALLLLLLMRFRSRSRDGLRRKIFNIFSDVERHARAEYERVSKSVFGSTPMPIPQRTEDMDKMREMFIRQNTTLINSVDDNIKEGLYYVIAQNAVTSPDKKAIEKQIADYLKDKAHIPENRAVLIGADQVGKLFGQMNQYNQMADGVEWYVWRTMNDSRVRKAHKAREGKAYRWADPPPDGHPGMPIRCRCHASALYNTREVGSAVIKGRYREYVFGEEDRTKSIVQKGE